MVTPAPIIRDFAAASRIASATGIPLVDDLVEQPKESRARMVGIRADATAWKILPNLVGQFAANVKYLKNTLGVGEMAASRALDPLAGREVLTATKGKSRGRVWQHRSIFDALDSYTLMIRGILAR